MTLKDEDIVYLNVPEIPFEATDPDETPGEAMDFLAMNENYIEPQPQKVTAHGLSIADVLAHIQYCKDTKHDGDFYTVEGAHWTYTAATAETKMHGYEDIQPACKSFSPSQTTIEALGAQLAREYKYDRAYSESPCCQSRMIDSPFCVASKNQADCLGYQPEGWQPVKLATGDGGQKLVMEKGRLYSGVPYARITKDGKIINAASGSDLNELDVVWAEVMASTNAVEQPLPELGPKNPYLQSLLT